MGRRTVSARNYSVAIIAERPLPADGFVLSHTLDTLGNADFEIERLVAHDSEEVIPYVGTTGVDADELESVLAEDPSVDEIERIARRGGVGPDALDRVDRDAVPSSSRRGRSSSPRATVRAGSCASCFPTGLAFESLRLLQSERPLARYSAHLRSVADATRRSKLPPVNERRTVFEPVRVLE